VSAGEASPRSVLLVDDTPEIRMLVRRALERSGDLQVVAEAGDGAAGLDAARAHRPDVVLLDIAMPVMDGLEALPLIREALPGATVIMLSGFGAEQMIHQAMSSGADGYIQKGQPMRQLVDRVFELMDGAGSGGGSGGQGPSNLLFSMWEGLARVWTRAPGRPRMAPAWS
jgi:DNA-binding NarL/FixJ family response regulator